ncbi:MAG: 50S ribosomal protein L9 [Flavobacteriales bacterium]|nr:MAG: 50S ribosomal protein L9 [Flavobacteriales bacterium]
MEIILKKDIEYLGLEFDVVNVKSGYARNFLIPKGYAVLATPKKKAELAEILEARKEEEAQLIADANAKIEKLKEISLTITTKAGDKGKLFGSINNAKLAEELANKGLEIDRKYIKIPGNTIKRTGKYDALVRLHREVEYNFAFDIVSDAPPVEKKEKPAKKEEKVEENKEENKEENTSEEA